MTDDHRLTCKGIAAETRKKQCGFGDILHRREFAIHGPFQHNVFDDFPFGNAKLFCLFRDLFVHKRRADKTRANDIGANAMLRAFLCDDLRKADKAVLGSNIRSFQR